MDEKFLTANRLLLEHAQLHQLLQVTRCRLPRCDIGLDNILDATIGQLEDQVDQLMAVDLWCLVGA